MKEFYEKKIRIRLPVNKIGISTGQVDEQLLRKIGISKEQIDEKVLRELNFLIENHMMLNFILYTIEKKYSKIIKKPNIGDICLYFGSDGLPFHSGKIIQMYGKKIIIATILDISKEVIVCEMNELDVKKPFSIKFCTVPECHEIEKLVNEFYEPERMQRSVDEVIMNLSKQFFNNVIKNSMCLNEDVIKH